MHEPKIRESPDNMVLYYGMRHSRWIIACRINLYLTFSAPKAACIELVFNMILPNITYFDYCVVFKA